MLHTSEAIFILDLDPLFTNKKLFLWNQQKMKSIIFTICFFRTMMIIHIFLVGSFFVSIGTLCTLSGLDLHREYIQKGAFFVGRVLNMVLSMYCLINLKYLLKSWASFWVSTLMSMIFAAVEVITSANCTRF